MDIVARDTRQSDLEEGLALALCRPHYDQFYGTLAQQEEELQTWRALLRRPGTFGGVTENLARPAGSRLITFGFAAFVNDVWLDKFLAAPFPFFGRWIIDQFRRGNRDILLDEEQIRHGNSNDGLSAMILASGWDGTRFTPEQTFAVKQAAVDSFKLANVGYRFRRYITEAANEIEVGMHLANATWNIWGDYETHYAATGSAPPAPRPLLLGMSKEEVQTAGKEISAIAPLFVWKEIRFCFTPEQQQILLAAREHDSDTDFADALGITIEALRRRLGRIYRRVAALQNPENPVFPPNANLAAKRRLLLQYLSKHPEELRPHNFRKKLQKGA